MGIFRFSKSVYHYIKKNGFSGATQKVEQMSSKIDVSTFYDFILDTDIIPFSDEDFHKHEGEFYINWFIPEMGVGSGGHLNIFRFVQGLQKKGIKNRVYVTNPSTFTTTEELKAFLAEHYNILDTDIEIYSGTENVEFAHASIATAWQTAYFLRRFDNTLKKYYFVQDFEPYFSAKGTAYYLAENTYKFGFIGITAGEWLKNKLREEYGMKCESFGFSYDKDLYLPKQKKDDTPRLFFYARPVTERRCFDLGLLALMRLYESLPNIEVVFAGWDISNYEIPFTHLNAGNVALSELCDLYSQCDICLVLSATNLSLLPLEIMASGSVVASDEGPQSDWLLNNHNAILVPTNPVTMADTLLSYLEDSEKLNKVRDFGINFAKNTSWTKEIDKVYEFLLKETPNEK